MMDTDSRDMERIAADSGLDLESADFIIYILKMVRARVSTSKTPAVTEAGRKAINMVHRPAHELLDDSDKPWKDRTTLAMLNHAVMQADAQLVKECWHLFIPPLLALLDDMSTDYRVHGIQLLATFLPKTSATILEQTGIGKVLEDALMPTLLFLPNLTPLEESSRLLGPAYDALILLGDIRFPFSTNMERRVKHFERILRQGILQGLSNCNDQPQIVSIIVRKMDALIALMGLYATSHLRAILWELCTRLSDPFIATHPSLLNAILRTLRTSIINCWPRIKEPIHYMEIVKAVSLCWTTQDSRKGCEAVNNMRTIVWLLTCCVDGATEREAFVNAVNDEPALRELLPAQLDDFPISTNIPLQQL